MGTQARRSPRYSFYASAQITDLRTGMPLTTRTSELSRHGCYLDMLTPLRLGTAVKVQVSNQEQTFEAKGRVIYIHPNMGMGVTFDEIEAGQELVIEKWLSDLRGT
ncbi:MAG TPA: PilZ domain-containing protein [Candidatus Acidoferrum sp.]|jgi:hypothetical protein|nr:PilZ domain-containing protein [Candidatus Acidoferrum sp.]